MPSIDLIQKNCRKYLKSQAGFRSFFIFFAGQSGIGLEAIGCEKGCLLSRNSMEVLLYSLFPNSCDSRGQFGMVVICRYAIRASWNILEQFTWRSSAAAASHAGSDTVFFTNEVLTAALTDGMKTLISAAA